MKLQEIKTFGELKQAGYVYQSVKDELRKNLIKNLRHQKNSFDGIYGYEHTVIPEIERAILSRHNINLLGLRGQAKTRIARMMVGLLDSFIPIVEGSEINDDPYRPISGYAKRLLAEKGDDTPLTWLPKEQRFAEKLATPDVTVADLIGDIDPIKAARLQLNYSDDRVIHFGMIPRANRCIFVLNELPDLQGRIQVALFNILQEGDVQIRGFNLRLPLDVQFVFTANPEDYTNRGSIVTPLKDRIGSQIITHYPPDVETAKKITRQEAHLTPVQEEKIYVPELALDLLEQIAFEARRSEFVDVKSGVSARMGISAYQNLMSTAERRLLLTGESQTTVRLSDFMGIIPALTGKVELLYEGEEQGPTFVALILLNQAIQTLFVRYFPKIEKLEKKNNPTPYDGLMEWFITEGKLRLPDLMDHKGYLARLNSVGPLEDLLGQYQPDYPEKDRLFLKEFLLWGLVSFERLSRHRFEEGLEFEDVYGNLINRL